MADDPKSEAFIAMSPEDMMDFGAAAALLNVAHRTLKLVVFEVVEPVAAAAGIPQNVLDTARAFLAAMNQSEEADDDAPDTDPVAH